ncbi:HAD family hydrolase [Streptomyces sp. NRAIS4]
MIREDLYATLRECDAYPDGLRFFLDTLGSGRAGTFAWQAVEEVYLRLYPAEPEETPGPEAPQDELSNLVTRARVVLFDFDGPICRLFASHSAERIAGELVDWLEERGLRGLLTEEESITPDPHVVMRAAGRLHPGSDVVAALEERLTAEELRAVTSAMPTPFADPLIRSWTAMGVRLAITTNNSPRAVMTYLRSRGLHDAFEPHIYGRTTDLDHLKPAPSVLNRALMAMDVEPEDALSIGDSPSDLEASRRADVPFLGYARNERKEELLRTAGAEMIVHSLESVLRVIMSASAS